MSNPSSNTTISQSKISQRTFSTFQDFVQSKQLPLKRIEHNLEAFIYWQALRKTIVRLAVLFIKHVMRTNPGINLST